MMLGIYDLMIYDSMIYDLWVKVQEEWLMMVWGDPLGAFWIQHQRILRAGHKRYQEGEPLQIAKAAASSLIQNLKLRV